MEQPQQPAVTDFAQGVPTDSSPLSQSARHDQAARFHENFDAGQRGSTLIDGDGKEPELYRSGSMVSQTNTLTPSRGGTLKKRQSLKKSGSIKRSSSRKSLRPGSVTSLALGDREKYSGGQGDELWSAFYTPVPTTGNPTDILADRFQGKSPPLNMFLVVYNESISRARADCLPYLAWRKVLKDLIAYYRDLQKSYEARSKSLMSLSNIMNSTVVPSVFLTEGGLDEASQILKQYNKQAVAESNKARNIEEDVIVQLSGLRSDLQQKIKEIKSLSGDFKNAVDKETESTRKAVRALQEALVMAETDPSTTSGKNDPFIVRLSVERQVERQIDEENYLHRAFLNLESSGRELESIVVGEIQKAYNAYAGILRREADEAYDAAERLKNGPIALRKDLEWDAFVDNNEHFVDPRLPVRKSERIHYPGKDATAAAEVRSGMLERKSKYLKSYTPGWYVLSPTHLHEFKSADSIKNQSPVMSLYLPEQKLGSHSNIDSSSHKFMLKGRQTGGIHRGHGWVFRAESRDTMLAWYEDIKNLTEKTGEERNAFVRRHARSVSGGSQKAGSVSSDGAMEEDEADEVPYSGKSSHFDQELPVEAKLPERPQTVSSRGRFPSDLNVNRGLHVPLSPSSGTSSDEREVIVSAGPLPSSSNHHQRSSSRVQKGKQVMDSENRGYVGKEHEDSGTGSRIRTPSRQSSYQGSENEERLDLGDGARKPIATGTNVSSLATADAMNTSRGPSKQPSYQMPQESNSSSSGHISPQPNANALQEYSSTPNVRHSERTNLPVIQGNYHATERTSYFPMEEDQTNSLPFQGPASLAYGAEYQTQPVESYGVSSEGPGVFAYATQQHSEPAGESAVPQPSKALSTPGEQPASINPALIGAKAGVHEEEPSQQSAELQSHILGPSDMPSAIELQTVATPQKALTPGLVGSPVGSPLPTPAPIELSQFGSTPKIDDAATFGNSFSKVVSGPVDAAKTSEGGKDSEIVLPLRPKVVSQDSVGTISDLHVPGEYPRGSR
ncbi:hypothetical protein MMC30_006677 [Trapelia coarctata]|nr:hypothetical protein [Trapelia coarctata]